MRKIFISLLLFSSVSFAFAQLPEGLSSYKLDNGLTVYLWEDHDQPDVFGATVTRAGSIDEPSTATGLAHYLEHMLFKGTEQIGALDWEKEKPYYEHIIALYDTLAQTTDAKEREAIQLKINEQSRLAAPLTATDEFSNLVQSIGGENLNAATSYDMTFYHNSFPAYQMERWLTLYADRLTNPVFRSFQAELENVFEEYNMYSDDNNQHVHRFVEAESCKGTPYERDIIGYPEDLKNPKLRQLIDFFHAWYVPNNMALILVGNFNTEEVKPLIEKTFGPMVAKELPARLQWTDTEFDKDKRFKARLGYYPMYVEVYKGTKSGDDDELALHFACELLSNDMGIGLLDELQSDNEFLMAGASLKPAREMGRIQLLAIPALNMQTGDYNSFSDTEKSIHKALDEILKGEISDELFEAIRMNLLQDYDRSMEQQMAKAYMLLQGFVSQTPLEEIIAEKEKLAKLTKDEVISVAKKYFSAPKKIFEISEGNPKKEKLAKPNIKPLDSGTGKSQYYENFASIPAGKLVPKFVDLKDIDQDRFAENVYVYVTPNPKNDIFTLRLKYGVGSFEKPLLPFAVELMNNAGIKGAPGTTVNEFRAKLAKLGGKCNYGVNDSYVIVDIEGPEKNLKEIVSLVNLHMLFPEFSSEDHKKLNGIIGREISSRWMERKNSSLRATAALDYVLYGENSEFFKRVPERNLWAPEIGIILQESDLEAEWHKALGYELEIHYAGQLPADSVKEALYSRIPMSQSATPTTSPIERPRTAFSKPELYFLADPDMQQAKIYLFIEGTPYNISEAVTYKAFNEYFGGGFSGLVMNEIREKRSMAYTAIGGFRLPPIQQRNTYFFGYVGTQSDKVNDAIKVYCSLLDSMPRNPENIDNIRTILRQSMLSNQPTFRTKSQRMTAWMRLGYQIDPATLQIRQVQKLKFEDIERFYEAHVQGKPLKMLVIGDPKLIDQKALKAQFGKINKLNGDKIFGE
ncbi:MAG: insulinase family protein [Paludibacteraceae bacterium]|nr:insulinase family protein [Paludibacteraceae bacterium]